MDSKLQSPISTTISRDATGELTAISPMGSYRWMICSLLFFATTINYLDRQVLSLLKPNYLDPLIGWTNAEFGMVNSAFQASYAISLLFFGWFVDKYGTKIGYAVSIGIWSLAAVSHSMIRSLSGFAVARVALGLGEGGNFPSAVKTVAQWFPKRERALATSLFNSGANVGAIMAPAFIPWIAATFGWQSAFIFSGLLSFTWLTLWLCFFEIPQKKKGLGTQELNYIESDNEETASQGKITWRRLLGFRETWAFIAAKFLTDPIWWFMLIWLPDFFNKTQGMDLKRMGLPIVTIYTIVTILSISGGYLSGWLIDRGWSSSTARKSAMLLFALCVLPVYFVTQISLWKAVVLIGVAGAAHQAWSATLFTSVSDIFPKQVIASVISLGSFAGSIGGMIFPILTGILLDHSSRGGYSILFGICSGAYLIALIINQILAPKFERINLMDTPLN